MIIGNCELLPGSNKIFFIAEIGLCHNGDLATALELIDAAVAAGADAVKFQKRTIDILADPATLDAADHRFPSFGDTYRKVREFIEFDASQYQQLFQHAKDKGIHCFVTPFDIPALDFCDAFSMPAIKIASHSVTDLPLLEAVSRKKKPVIMSTGMVSIEEIERAVAIFKQAGVEVALLHCVSSYPTNLSQANLRAMDLLWQYSDLVGFSGHETDHIVTLSAAARGARIIERHITTAHDQEGFDHAIALDPEELKRVIRQIRKIEVLLGDGQKSVTEHEMLTRNKYRRSIASALDLPAGTQLQEHHLVMMNPGTGIPPAQLDQVLGKTTLTAIAKGSLLKMEDLQQS